MKTLKTTISMYRETHLLATLGWVDFDFGCSILCLVLRGVMIPAVESIPESDFGHFLEFSDSDSDSNSIPQLS